MSTRVADRVDGWSSRSYNGDLHALADAQFSGVVRSGGAEGYVTKGTVVAVERGTIEDLLEPGGTIYQAPDPSLPLLAVMQSRAGEARAEYYTEETPITEVDRTLSEGGFTGFVELSDNVLSGDYYVVYHAGESSAVGFVGNTQSLITEDEAFETADDEVGIYEVFQVGIEPVELPDRPGEADTAPVDSDATADASAEPTDAPEATTSADDAGGAADASAAGDGPDGSEGSASTSTATLAEADTEPASTDDGATARATEPADGDAVDDSGGETAPADDADDADRDSTDDAGDGATAPGPESASDLETRSVPSVDPDRTVATSDGAASSASGGQRGGAGARGGSTLDDPAAASRSELQAALADRENRIQRLEAELESVREERGDLESELEALRTQRDGLQARVERLESGGAGGAASGAGSGSGAGQSLSPEEALSGSNLFVRYESKGAATLESAMNGEARKEDVADNLRLEYHTEFDAGDVTVEGQPFAEFLGDQPTYRFVRWLVEDLPFEIRDTGSAAGMADLYDALPEIDRVQLRGTVSVGGEDGAEDAGDEERFDVVCRDRMGEPLVVVTIDQSRQGTTESTMTNLLTAAERVGQSADTLAAAVAVSHSFFEPGALEAASEATRSGLLSRDKRLSYVNLARKQGYHLCLVEAREGSFHLTVPDL